MRQAGVVAWALGLIACEPIDLAPFAARDGWFALGGSEIVSHSDRLALGSASGGGVSANRGASRRPTVVLDDLGRPTIAWRDNSSGVSRVYLRRWNDAWQELAGSASGDGLSATGDAVSDPCRLALDPDGEPVVVWQAGGSISVRRFHGDVWQQVEELTTTATSSQMAAVAVHTTGNPVVAWEGETSGEWQIHVKRWAGSGWEAFGSSEGIAVTAGESRTPVVALTAAGHPIVAWSEAGAQIFLLRWTGAIWEELDGSASTNGLSATAGSSTSPALILDAANNPYVAWSDDTPGGGTIYLKRWNGVEWEPLGGSSSGAGIPSASIPGGSALPQIGLDGSSQPVVAWQQWGGVEAKRWTGNAWEALGGADAGPRVSHTAGNSRYPSLAVHGDTMVVAWEDDTPGMFEEEVYVQRWDAPTNEWVELGAVPSSTALNLGAFDTTRFAALAIDADQRPLVAWERRLHPDPSWAFSGVFVLRWDHESWQPLGSSAAGLGTYGNDASDVALAVGDDSRVIAVWRQNVLQESVLTREIYVRRWTGETWEELDGSASSSGLSNTGGQSSRRPAVAVFGERIAVAWDELVGDQTQVYLRLWDGSMWTELGGSASNNGVNVAGEWLAHRGALAFDTRGRLTVAFEGSFPRQIYVRRWTDGRWEELDGSGSATGITQTGSTSEFPSVAIDLEDSPVVAWSEGSSIRVKRWTGATWEDVGPEGSFGDSGWATEPRVVVNRHGEIVVAWRDGHAGQYEAYLRRFTGSVWEELDGSGSAGGVTNSTASSSRPALAIGWRAVCLAWHEMTWTRPDVFLRCHH